MATIIVGQWKRTAVSRNEWKKLTESVHVELGDIDMEREPVQPIRSREERHEQKCRLDQRHKGTSLDDGLD